MEKPITMRVAELKRELAQVLNDAELHPYFLEKVTAEIHNECADLLLRVQKAEEEEYQKNLEEAE